MEQKQIQIQNDQKIEGKPEYQVFKLNGVKLDYFDLDLALQGISSEILYVQAKLRKDPNHDGLKKYNAMLHTTESKLQRILSQMDRPPENQIRPSGLTY